MSNRVVVGVLGFVSFVLANTAATTRVADAQQPPPQWGWYIAINTTKTETGSISFAAGPSKDGQKWTHTWKRGEPATFWVGAPGAQSPQLYLNAAVGEKDKNGWFCLMFMDNTGNRRGVKHWHFDDSEDRTVKNTDRDGECGG